MRGPQTEQIAMTRRHSDRSAGIGAERKIHQSVADRGSGAGRRPAGVAIRRGTVDRSAEVRIAADDRKREFLGVRLAGKTGPGVKQLLNRSGMSFPPTHQRQHHRIADAGRVAGHVEDILDRKTERRQRTRWRGFHRRRRIRHECPGQIAFLVHQPARSTLIIRAA